MRGKLIQRQLSNKVRLYLDNFPAVAILGPRQAGKSTLAKQIIRQYDDALYLDLEKPSDANKLGEAEVFFKTQQDHLICLDEIQRVPELFPLLRSIIDENNRNGQLLILGSASRDLIKQSSESLAGRIVYIELTPFLFNELKQENDHYELPNYWLRGGFPLSYLAEDDSLSLVWRQNFVHSFLERDIPQLGFNIAAESLRRLWQMIAHVHGQILNHAMLANSIDVTPKTIRSYLDILSQTFMVRLLQPYHANLKKRLVKSPKVYIRDSGILHALLQIETFNDLMGHPVYGASWEGLMIENISAQFPDWEPFYYRTSAGAELDLVLVKGQKRMGFEFKASKAPKVVKGFWNAVEDLELDHVHLVAPVDDAYPYHKKVTVIGPGDIGNLVKGNH